jgi:hypothetical protein
VLPLSLHVDYWNNLGWRDPFSQTRFSERQREAARRGQTKFVYTPQFLLNGVDSRDGLAEKVRRINNSKASAEINLTMKRQPATKPEERGAARFSSASCRAGRAPFRP